MSSKETLLSLSRKAVSHGRNAEWLTITGAKIYLSFLEGFATLKQYTHNGVVSVNIPIKEGLRIAELSKEQETLLTYVSSLHRGIKERDAKEHLSRHIPAKCNNLARKIPTGDIVDLDGSFAVSSEGQLLARSESGYRNISTEFKELDLINQNYIFCLLLEK